MAFHRYNTYYYGYKSQSILSNHSSFESEHRETGLFNFVIKLQMNRMINWMKKKKIWARKTTILLSEWQKNDVKVDTRDRITLLNWITYFLYIFVVIWYYNSMNCSRMHSIIIIIFLFKSPYWQWKDLINPIRIVISGEKKTDTESCKIKFDKCFYDVDRIPLLYNTFEYSTDV